MSSGFGGGAAHSIWNGFTRMTSTVTGCVFTVIAIIATFHVLPLLFTMAVYHNDLQKGVDKGVGFIKFGYSVAGAAVGSSNVGWSEYDKGQKMAEKSIPKAKG